MKTTTLDHKLASIKDSYESFKQVHESLNDLNNNLLQSPLGFTWDIWENINWILENEGDCSLQHFANMLGDVIGYEAIAQAVKQNLLNDQLEYEIRTYSYAVIVPIGLRTPAPKPASSAENILKQIRMRIPLESTKSNSQATGSNLDTSKLKQMLAGLAK